MTLRVSLTRSLIWLVLIAAIASAPVFLVAEELDLSHALRVAAANGGSAILCVLLLVLIGRGHGLLAGKLLVAGLLALVVTLASTNGEDVHVNVVNFVLVTVLASAILGTRALVVVSIVCALSMIAIAVRRPILPPGEELFKARLESIAQFLPSYIVIVMILWLQRREARTQCATR